VLATLIRLLGDFGHSRRHCTRSSVAVERWPKLGFGKPARVARVTGRFKAIDAMRRRAVTTPRSRSGLAIGATESRSDAADGGVEDDRLRLVFTCCHPAPCPMLRSRSPCEQVCGLTTEIARAFLTGRPLAQRIVRAKSRFATRAFR
jgi:RNA polymerase sigma-70 factor (ECF subfamily)